MNPDIHLHINRKPPYVVALTGASGLVYGMEVVRGLVEAGKHVGLVISEGARLVFKEELGAVPRSFLDATALESFFGFDFRSQVTVYNPRDLAASLASGSYPTEGMAIVPCSMGTLGAVAGGFCQNLIHRAADVTLKESRPLLMVPRETPLSALHLENMLKLARLGVRIVPAMPGFYAGAREVQDLVRFVAGRVLDQWKVPHGMYPRWVGSL